MPHILNFLNEVTIFVLTESFVYRLFNDIITIHYIVFTQIPPAPPRPDFDASREKLQKLGEGEGTMTKEEFNKMKQELEA
jgi:sorting nexin-5/6/32